MPKHATRTCCVRLNLNRGAPLRGWRPAQANGQRRWSGGKKSMTHTASRSRTGATMSALRSSPVKYRWPRSRWKRCWHNAPGRRQSIIMFAGQVAARQSDPVLAVDYAERALADKRAKPYDILAAATLILSVTNPQFAAIRRARGNKLKLWRAIQRIQHRWTRSLFLQAKRRCRPCLQSSGNASLSLESTPAPSPTPATQGATASSARR